MPEVAKDVETSKHSDIVEDGVMGKSCHIAVVEEVEKGKHCGRCVEEEKLWSYLPVVRPRARTYWGSP